MWLLNRQKCPCAFAHGNSSNSFFSFCFLFFFVLNLTWFFFGHDFYFLIIWVIFFFLVVCHFFVLIGYHFFNKGIWVNLYILFSSFHFSIPNQIKRREIKIFSILSLFHPLTFPSFQPNKPLDKQQWLLDICIVQCSWGIYRQTWRISHKSFQPLWEAWDSKL